MVVLLVTDLKRMNVWVEEKQPFVSVFIAIYVFFCIRVACSHDSHNSTVCRHLHVSLFG